ncbi:MAG: hypothetical protein HKM89_01800 [Gemmatimonadales bacterium]|nr:hypothetical protein [Gemmatimonadales bacterium]
MRPFPLLTALSIAFLGLATVAGAQEKEGMSPKAKIAEAVSAGPAELATNAAVVDWDGTVLREGSNGWTCFPDVKDSPGTDPMCLDQQWMKWADAWVNKKDATGVTEIGIGYMLRGGYDASNTDPYATGPAEGDDWIRSGPHLMVITPDAAALDNLPTDPKSGGPWVMWKGTPFAHIMVPISGPKAMKHKH